MFVISTGKLSKIIPGPGCVITLAVCVCSVLFCGLLVTATRGNDKVGILVCVRIFVPLLCVWLGTDTDSLLNGTFCDWVVDIILCAPITVVCWDVETVDILVPEVRRAACGVTIRAVPVWGTLIGSRVAVTCAYKNWISKWNWGKT